MFHSSDAARAREVDLYSIKALDCVLCRGGCQNQKKISKGLGPPPPLVIGEHLVHSQHIPGSVLKTAPVLLQQVSHLICCTGDLDINIFFVKHTPEAYIESYDVTHLFL